MIYKKNILGIDYSVTDYEQASDYIINAAKKQKSFAVSALAVHGLISSIIDKKLYEKIKKIHMIVPDGQPIKWALNYFYQLNLKDRVYGPELTLYVLEKASIDKLNIFLYGSTEDTLKKFKNFILKNYTGIKICGIHIDRFRDSTNQEDMEDIKKINNSKANIVLVGRGCPRQEIWVSDHINKINAPMLAVGAAFDFHAGKLKQAPKIIQDYGLEWLYRLIQEPRRLWKRYLFTNSYFIFLIIKKMIKRIIGIDK